MGVRLCLNPSLYLCVAMDLCGLSKCITRYLVAMSVADLIVVIISVIFGRIVEFYFPNSFVYLSPICVLLNVLDLAARTISVWLTVAFTFDRYVAICCQNLKKKYCTGKTACTVIASFSLFFLVQHIPWYFAYEPLYIIDSMPWGCTMIKSFVTALPWVVFDLLNLILTPRARNRLRKSIILLFAVSANFILLWMTYVLYYLYWRISKRYYFKGIDDPAYITWRTGFMLQLLSSCTNTCIYAVTQTKFREEIKKAVKFPYILILRL
uniref:G-protein coupled receptors family 1 profile domain-containing protein n=1 Tax=Callorhinchus milii TaxID=7868 RepID=A0A4W3HFE4_CALMI